MAYADHSETSSRTVSIVIVVLIHAALGYAFVTGLGMKYVKKAAEQLNVIDVKEEPPPPDEPPPPPPPKAADVAPPPVVSPPALVETPSVAPPIQTSPTPQPLPSPIPLPAAPSAPPAPPAPPAPKFAATKAAPRGAPGNWVTPDDYPSRALREGRTGTTGFRLEIGPNGQVTNCTVTSSSGHADLDAEACRLLTRRARFKPAKGTDGNPTSDTYSNRIVWRMPD